MLKTPSLWRIAVSLCILYTVVSLLNINSINLPLPGTLTQRIIPDKNVYHVGDTIHAENSFVNTNGWAVPFSPPNEYSGMQGSYEGESSTGGVDVHATYTSSTFVVPTGEAFNLISQDFRLGKVGKFSIRCGSASIIVDVLS